MSFPNYPQGNYFQGYGQYPQYNGYGQRPYMSNQQYAQQVMQQNQPTPNTQQSINNNIVDLKISSLEEAKAYMVAPNTSVLFLDIRNFKAYLKTALPNGESYIKYFNYVETDENGKVLNQEKEEPKINLEQFVTKNDLNDFIKQFNFVTRQEYEKLVGTLKSIYKKGENNVDTNTEPNN